MKKIVTTIIIVLSLFVGLQSSAQSFNTETQNSIIQLLTRAQTLLQDPKMRPVVVNIVAQAQALLSEYLAQNQTHIVGIDKPAFENQDDFLGLYSVENLELIFKDGEEGDVDFAAWELFKDSSDVNIVSNYVKFFAVYEDDSDTFAYVEESEEGNVWVLAINLGNISLDSEVSVFEAAETMIHEFSHVLTLNSSQVPDGDPDTCPGHYVAEGCPLKSSYFQTFIDTFWNSNDIQYVLDVAEELDEDYALEAIEEFYEANPERFVSDYAATNPGEDIAESFNHFIFKEKSELDSQVKDLKAHFFYRYPELVNLRNAIRKNMKSIIDLDRELS